MSAATEGQTFTLHYFATARSYTARASDQLPAPLPLHKLFPELEARYPGITDKILRSCAVTVNLDYVDVDEDAERSDASTKPSEGNTGMMIKPGDEVAIIPPVSSG